MGILSGFRPRERLTMGDGEDGNSHIERDGGMETENEKFGKEGEEIGGK